jgi:hypothetical protein
MTAYGHSLNIVGLKSLAEFTIDAPIAIGHFVINNIADGCKMLGVFIDHIQ